MYFDTYIAVPEVKGKITIRAKKYVMYETERRYNKDKKYNVPVRVTIGILKEDDHTLMKPNENYSNYFDNNEFEYELKHERSSCLRIGNYSLMERLFKESGIDEILPLIFTDDTKIIKDLVAYNIISESNKAQYYEDYAYNHPLFTERMYIYSDSYISDLFKRITTDQINSFLNILNYTNKNKEGIYISYDSTNKNCQALDIDIAEFGHAKDDESKPIINIAIGYDINNRKPLFYEEYPGSIVDMAELDYMVDKAKAYGYTKNIGFILDRGYFSKANITHLEEKGMDYIIAAKGSANFIRNTIKEAVGTFEKDRNNRIPRFQVYGTTIKKSIFSNTVNSIHIYYNELKAAIDKENIETRIERLEDNLKRYIGTDADLKAYEHYFEAIRDKDNIIAAIRPKNAAIEEEKKYCGYFTIVTSEDLTAAKALTIYKQRDSSEKLFRADKSYLGGSSFRVQSSESIRSKTFISFLSLIIRNKIHTSLLDYEETEKTHLNYMNVPACLKELEKIEMIKGFDGLYRLDHALTATQKKLLKAFDMSVTDINATAKKIKETLQTYNND